MKVRFHVNYRTQPGETLHVLLYREGAAANEQKINIPLTVCENNWTGEIQLLLKQPLRLNYHYEVRSGARTLRREWQGSVHVLDLQPSLQNYVVYDRWQDAPSEPWLQTSCMTQVWRRRQKPLVLSLPVFKRTLVLQTYSARPNVHEELCISGSVAALGNWDTAHALPMAEIAPNTWAVSLDAEQLSFPFEYKFLVRFTQDPKAICWEENKNRIFQEVSLQEDSVEIWNQTRPVFAAEKPFRTAGLEIPLFSLRSKNGWGVGDFGDIPLLVDWAVKTGLRAIEFLPVNDTTFTRSWQDSSPYRTLSVFALHPIYVDIRALPQSVQDLLAPERAALNEAAELDYEGALQLKLKGLKYAFEQEGYEQLASPQFQAFFKENEYWLPGYAMFCVLRDRFNTADHARWSQYVFFAREDARQFCALGAPDEQEVRFWYYVQFVLHTQFLKSAQYAREKGVVLIGDIPLGVSPKGVDAWMDPGFFRTDTRVGTPPDDYFPTGQKWELSAYNWEVIARDGYRWWQRRMAHLSYYFDAYRLDHVQGLFRMWEIPPAAAQGVLGQFVPAKGFTKEELENKGFVWKDSFLKPYISQEVLEKVCGVLSDYVKQHFLQSNDQNYFEFQAAYDTQAKIAAALPEQTPEVTLLRDNLLELAANVLFVKDIQLPGVYHPRANAWENTAFLALPPEQQTIFKTLYEDYFSTRQNEIWKQTALTHLTAVVNSSNLLCCGEDLGILPKCLPEVTQKLGILRLEVGRMPKTDKALFSDPASYAYLSVAMPGTHDMSVLRAWWKEDAEDAQLFWKRMLKHPDDAPAEANQEVCEEILSSYLKSPALLMLALFQDWASLDTLLRGVDSQAERINDPADFAHRWKYRLPLALEDLLEQTAFNEKIKKLIVASGR